MNVMASQITSVSIVRSTICSNADQRNHQSSTSLAYVRGIHWWTVDSLHKGPVTWKMFHLMTIMLQEKYTCSMFCCGFLSLGTASFFLILQDYSGTWAIIASVPVKVIVKNMGKRYFFLSIETLFKLKTKKHVHILMDTLYWSVMLYSGEYHWQHM